MLKYILLGLLLSTNVIASETITVTGTSKEMKCLADNIYFEARNESVMGQLAVALVTTNRVKSTKYPNTVCKVVWEYKQFSWTIDGLSDIPKNKKAYKQSKRMANYVLNNNAIDFTLGATHYHAIYIKPYWAKNLKHLMVIENHIFYTFKK